MNIVYFEDAGTQQLLPLTWLRAPFELRCGRDRLIDKARNRLSGGVARLLVRPALRDVVRERIRLDHVDSAADWCVLNARALVTAKVPPPQPGVAWQRDGHLVAAGLAAADVEPLTFDRFQTHESIDEWLQAFRVEHAPRAVRLIRYPWDLPLANEAELRRQLGDGGVHLGRISPGAHLIEPSSIHVAAGASVRPGVVLDAEAGPIHIAEDACVEPNAVLVGPCCVGRKSTVRSTAVIRSGTTIGPSCIVGGEVEAAIFQGYSNKPYRGYLGHSYVARWVNLGAETITGNLKNTYGTVRVNLNGVGVETGQHFVGAFIGDHAKTGIGTMLPTGCVIGVAASIFSHGPVPKFVPSFGWVTDAGLEHCRLEKAIQIAGVVMGWRDRELTEAERRLLERTAELARETEAAGWR